MAPIAVDSPAPIVTPVAPAASKANAAAAANGASFPRPLQLTGILDQYEFSESTPVIGREYPTLQAKELINAPNADELLRELAIITSRRGVVFLRNQDLTPEEQKEFTDRLGKASGRPSTSGLHIHPIINAERKAEHQALDKDGKRNLDNEISIISSKFREEVYYEARKTGASEWHSDVTFEPAPADYTTLKVHTLPPTGGDTLFSSGYEIYDLLSEPLKKLFEGLTGYFAQPAFIEAAARGNFRVFPGPRGSTENVGTTLDAHHPIVRTNPVTGWKSLFALGSHFDSFEGLKREESDLLKDYILRLVTSEHAAQVRFKWGPNDLAVFDNRSVYHAATPDYKGLGDRAAVRVISVGEKPYFDPDSVSRREELGHLKLI
ncbi:unnamed protein product [Sympodiomycopsis kandeliae]